MKNIKVKLGEEISIRKLILLMGDAVLGLIVNGGGASDTFVIVARKGDFGLRLVTLERDLPPANNFLELEGVDAEHQPLHVVTNPQDVIKVFQSRYYLICKAYGLRH